jgi:predicted phage terminase large subunit-like protein
MSGADLGQCLKIISETEMPHWSDLEFVRAWDLAATEGGGDYTVGLKMARSKTTGKVFIPHLVRAQKSPKGVEALVGAVGDMDGYGVPVWMEQEPGSSGKIVMDHYNTDVMSGHSFKGEKATGDIRVRAQPFLAAVEAGNVYIVKADWNDDLIDEIDAFPDGDNDDQVSAGALAYYKLHKNKFGGATWGRHKNGRILVRNPKDQARSPNRVVWGRTG